MRWPVVPCEQIEKWLRGTVVTHLKAFYPTFLSRDHPLLFNAVIATLAHSCAKAVFVHQHDHVDDRNLFLLLIVRLAETLEQFVSSDLLDALDTKHIFLALGHYTVTMVHQQR